MVNRENLKGVVTLKSIVANVKNDIEDYSQEGYNRLLQFAIRGVKRLFQFAIPSYEVRWITMTDINTVNLPDDFMSLIAVGIPYRGKLWTFTKENKLIDPVSESEGLAQLDADRGETSIIGDGDFPEGYGVSGGRNKFYYKYDETNRRLIINGFDRTEVLVYYRSTGIAMNEETNIPAIAEEAVIAFVHWKRVQHDRTSKAYDKQMAENTWNNEYEIMKNAQMPSLDEIYDQIYSTYTQSPKR